MATRYLWVDISRRQISSVILAVDDEAPEWREALSVPTGLRKAWEMARPYLAEAADKTLTSSDWEVEFPEDLDIDGVKELPAKEARQYRVYEVPAPTPAEVRQEREAEGQMTLEVS